MPYKELARDLDFPETDALDPATTIVGSIFGQSETGDGEDGRSIVTTGEIGGSIGSGVPVPRRDGRVDADVLHEGREVR